MTKKLSAKPVITIDKKTGIQLTSFLTEQSMPGEWRGSAQEKRPASKTSLKGCKLCARTGKTGR
ncbi:MAG: hypothetical protein II942_00380 [Alphaproteobacteria bacterium]|nr:hypothetical protein [Alphaproteobacteria bacterium]